MCGRYTLRRAAMIAAAIDAMLQLPELDDFYDASPARMVPVVRLDDARRVIDLAKWGFVPVWAKPDQKIPKSVNAKSETVATNGMFRSAFKSSRCLLPADGFYEPKGPKTMKNRPQFYFHRPDHAMFAMAGVWSHTDAGNTFALITTTPNKLMAPIHDRMPVILDRAAYESWLNPNTPVDALQRLLRPAPEADLIFEAVTPQMHEELSLFD